MRDEKTNKMNRKGKKMETIINTLAQGVAFVICGGFLAIGLIGLFSFSVVSLWREGSKTEKIIAVLFTVGMIVVIIVDYVDFNIFNV